MVVYGKQVDWRVKPVFDFVVARGLDNLSYNAAPCQAAASNNISWRDLHDRVDQFTCRAISRANTKRFELLIPFHLKRNSVSFESGKGDWVCRGIVPSKLSHCATSIGSEFVNMILNLWHPCSSDFPAPAFLGGVVVRFDVSLMPEGRSAPSYEG